MGLLQLHRSTGFFELDTLAEVVDRLSIPVIAGGGIRTPEDAADRANAGASFVVVGSVLEQRVDTGLIRSFAEAIHTRR